MGPALDRRASQQVLVEEEKYRWRGPRTHPPCVFNQAPSLGVRPAIFEMSC